MKYRAIIFDMDGLILDTEIIESRSFEKLLKEYEVKPRPNPNGLIHEVGGGMKYFENFKEKYNLTESIENIRDKKRAFWAQIVKEEGVVAFPGFLELLALLKKEGFKIALASNRNDPFVHLVLDTLGAKEFFHLVVGSSNEKRKQKPFPDIYLHVAKELGISPEQCVVLEDSEAGVISAKAAGMKVIAIPNIYTKEHDFSRADIIIKSLEDINMELLENL
ncbi:MAG: HAD family phosphatase [Patescibacteria group bacterium]